MAINEERLNFLCKKLGILLSFFDYESGRTHLTDIKTKQVICRGLGYPAQSDEAVEKSIRQFEENTWQQIVEPALTVYEEELHPLIFDMSVLKSWEHTCIAFELLKEDGSSDKGSFWFHDMPYIEEKEIQENCLQKRRIYLFLSAPLGYHKMRFSLPENKTVEMNLLVVPKACYQPQETPENKYIYGFPVQLYALRSKTNLGIGDFNDLKQLADVAHTLQAGLIGINPLSALFEDAPQDASPYSASSRLFINPLYIDVFSIPELQTAPEIQSYIKSPEFQKKVALLRKTKKVNYPEAAALKFDVLNRLYNHFKTIADPKRQHAFKKFCKKAGDSLDCFATYQALRYVFSAQKKPLYWRHWDKAYQNPKSAEVKAFQKSNADLINAVKYRQFIAFEQYDAAAAYIQKRHLPFGLYTDMPVGVCENSAEVWSKQELFIKGVSVGAPPDAFNRKGQDWGLAAFHPFNLAKTGFAAYKDVVRQMMRSAGAVRIDHAFGLERLFLRVKNASGAYLTYPYKTLIGIVALESVKACCTVIAEDLGTAPAGFSEKMVSAEAYSFKILRFYRQNDTFLPPKSFPYYSLIASGTHDMPSLSAYFKGLDLALAKQLGTVTEKQYKMHRRERLEEKKAFINAFCRAHYAISQKIGKITIESKKTPAWFIENIYRYLNDSGSRIVMVRLEDVFEQDEQVNMPGTCFEYPNWRHKLPVMTEDFMKDRRLIKIVDLFMEKRRRKK